MQAAVVNTESRKPAFAWQMEGIRKQIDLLVYELYGLNEGHRQGMEGGE